MKRMLINAAETEEVRVAILDEDRLEDLDIEVGEGNSIKGNIYRAQVINIEPSIQAAFVNYGADRNGFLPLDEVNPKALCVQPREGRSRKSQIEEIGKDNLRPKQEILVQVTRDPIGQKGAALTTYIALPGQFLVYLPQTEGGGGISRRIEDSGERSRMKEKIAGLNLTADVSVIVRTAGLERTAAELKRELKNMEKLFKAIQKAFAAKKEPGLLYREEGVALRMVRDYFHDDIEEVWVDEPDTFTAVQAFFQLTLPKFAERVKLYDGLVPLFTRYHVEEQIEHTMTRHVPLPSGGSIVIDQTEALVAIDVNSGRTRQEKNIEDTALKTNLEAAGEIARQLRLRNMGGIVVCDFIDMRDRKNRAKVQTALSKALAPDKAQTTLGRISQFGTIELLRQRMRTAGGTAGWTPCPACEGLGRVRNPVREAMAIFRQLALEVASSKEGTLIEAKVPAQAALYLLNEKRYELRRLEVQGRVKIIINPADVKEPSIVRTSEAFKFTGRADEVVTREQMRPAAAVSLVEALSAEPDEVEEETQEAIEERPKVSRERGRGEGGRNDQPRDRERPRGRANAEGGQPREGRPLGETPREKRRRLRRERESRMIREYTASEPGDSVYDPYPAEPVRRPGDKPPAALAPEAIPPREIVEKSDVMMPDEIRNGEATTEDEEPVAISDEVSSEDYSHAGSAGAEAPVAPQSTGDEIAPVESGEDEDSAGEDEGEDGEAGDESADLDDDAVDAALNSAVKQAGGGKPKPRRRGGRGRGGKPKPRT